MVLFSLNDLAVNGQGTTDLCRPSPINFMDLYLQKCSTLQINSSTCQSAWTSFAAAFAGIDPLTVTPE